MKPCSYLPVIGCFAIVWSAPAWIQTAAAGDLIVDDSGARAVGVQSGRPRQLDLQKGTITPIVLPLEKRAPNDINDDELSPAEAANQLIGFSSTGEVLGFSRAKVWSFDPRMRSTRELFVAAKDEQIRYAALHRADDILVSVFPAEYDRTADEGLSFSIKAMIDLRLDGQKATLNRTKVRREVLPAGSVFDRAGILFFPMGDIYAAAMDHESNLNGGRCIPTSTARVFTGGASPSTYGARSIAVSDNMVYAVVNRLGGSGYGYVVRFREPPRRRSRINEEDEFVNVIGHYRSTLSSMEVLQSNVSSASVAGSPNGKHVLIRADDKWFLVDDDGPVRRINLRSGSE